MRVAKALAALFVVGLIAIASGCSGNETALTNRNLERTVPFLVEPQQSAPETSMRGALFVYGDGGSKRQAALSATFDIAPDDESGIYIAIPLGVRVVSVDCDYRSDDANPWSDRPYVYAVPPHDGVDGFISIASSFFAGSSAEGPSGSGPGTIVACFEFDESFATNGAGSCIEVSLVTDDPATNERSRASLSLVG